MKINKKKGRVHMFPCLKKPLKQAETVKKVLTPYLLYTIISQCDTVYERQNQSPGATFYYSE